MMTLSEWIEQLPDNWDETAELDECALCHDDEVWDYNLCIACAEELNENDWLKDEGEWMDGDALASIGWGTDEDYGYYGN